MPIGTLMRKPVPGIWSVIHAERWAKRGGNHDGEGESAKAMPRFSGGNISARIDYAAGRHAPAAEPLEQAEKISDGRLRRCRTGTKWP